jgi:ubiquinone/menaquinone biosynthesis C-methylase UbiE
MKLAATPETVAERVGLRLGLVPTPLIETWQGFMLARTIMLATKCGVFEALRKGTRTSAEVAEQCGTHPRSTEKLLVALAGAGYLRVRGDRFELLRVARKWLLREGEASLHDKMLFQFLEWDWWSHSEDFLRNGRPVEIHKNMKPDEWALYQRGMRAGKDGTARELARRLPLAEAAERMLDIGGAHGLYAAELCRRHPRMRATILDLPEAIRHAAPLLAAEGIGERIEYLEGDALVTELGEEHYDLVFIGSLLHHFSEDDNRRLLRRIARALRRGGIIAILEVPRARRGQVGQLGGLLDFYFAMTSASGTWSEEEVCQWQHAAGLTRLSPIRLRSAPNVAIQLARK